jgi:ABC-type transport system substrate-binding protein
MSWHEDRLRDWLAQVRAGHLSRRRFVEAATGLGLGATMALQLLAHAGLAHAQVPFTYTPTRRGGGGALRILSWQGVTILNSHFSAGSKDQLAARLFCEPLATFDGDGSLIPVLAAEIPSVANGGLARDGLSVTWKLKRGVSWHDGEPFTADDVVFTWELLRDPEAAAYTIGTYQPIKVRKLDSHTVRIEFAKPTPEWADAFVVQAIFKQAANAAGIEVELKAVVGTVFFSSDTGNPDTQGKFQADLQMYTSTRGGPEPGRFMELFCSWLIASKANKWLGRNVMRWRSDEYDRTYRASEIELDPTKRAALLIRLNDIVCTDHVVVPIIARSKMTAMSNKLRVPISGWAVESSRIGDWYRA